MCGIAGLVWKSLGSKSTTVLEKMSDSLYHRGPDGAGIWSHRSLNIGLVHRRLAILDVSEAGKQPMMSNSHRYVVSFNGEIYNFFDIKSEIARQTGKTQYRGGSDTEVILAALDVWGLEGAIKKLEGMFAISIWDESAQALYLVRDRMGEKPLYYGFSNGTFAFGSELKVFRAIHGFDLSIDPNAVSNFVRYSFVEESRSIYKEVKKLPPASYLKISLDSIEAIGEPVKYWDLNNIATIATRNQFSGTDEQAIQTLDGHLSRIIKLQMISDVPLGAFLSGGIDSSTIVACMQRESTRPVKTFTIGFEESHYDESKYAEQVAHYLGTDHTTLNLNWNQALSLIPRLPEIYDEPFADSSQIPTFLVAQLARQNVTVALSGDAGDEVFGGYNRHQWIPKIWRRTECLTRGGRRLVGNLLNTLRPDRWDNLFSIGNRFLSNAKNPGEKLQKLANSIGAANVQELYDFVRSQGLSQTNLMSTDMTTKAESSPWLELDCLENTLMLADMNHYLPGDILAKVDRAAMAVSLETRVPFLDHQLIEFAWSLPLHMKIRNGEGKWILRRVLEKYVPSKLFDRPKSGFGVPIDSWLRGPLKEWASDLLSMDRIRRDGYFDAEKIQKLWDEHLSGKRRWHHQLWNILMFNAWLSRYHSN
jgi:asparagine synthase (glutamine-hydrolysing)